MINNVGEGFLSECVVQACAGQVTLHKGEIARHPFTTVFGVKPKKSQVRVFRVRRTQVQMLYCMGERGCLLAYISIGVPLVAS